MLHVRLKNES